MPSSGGVDSFGLVGVGGMRVKVADAAEVAADSDCRRLPRVLRDVDFPFAYSVVRGRQSEIVRS